MSTPEQNAATLERATRTVFGILAARDTNSVADANFLIDSYLQEEVELGRTTESSWALLVSASCNVAASLMHEDAARNHTSVSKRVNHWSAEHARSLA